MGVPVSPITARGFGIWPPIPGFRKLSVYTQALPWASVESPRWGSEWDHFRSAGGRGKFFGPDP